MSRLLMAHIALLIVGIIYGLNYSIAKLVLDNGYIQPSGFIFFRVLFGILFFTFLLRQRAFSFPFLKKEYPRLILCGLFGVATNQLLFFKGLQITTPINASLIMTNTPILVLLFGLLGKTESFGWNKIIGVLLGAVGATMLISNGFQFQSFSSLNLGDLYVLLNASSYAIYLHIVKRLLSKYPSLEVVRMVFLLGLFFVVPFGFGEALTVDWSSFPSSIILAFAYVLLFTTGLTYLLNAFSLKLLSPTIVGIYIYLQPLIASIAGIFFGQNEILSFHLIAGALIFLGVFTISYPRLKLRNTTPSQENS